MSPSRSDRFVGCLLGQALGDALGFVVEGRGPAECRAWVEGPMRTGAWEGAGRGRFPVGQYSDDTQLARELLRSWVARRAFDPADYARRIARLFSSGRIVGRGKATQDAADRLSAGVPWHRAGTPAPAAGNGTAMRAAPVGLMLGGDARALVRVSHDQSRITHADPRCSAGAIVVAGVVAQAMSGSLPSPRRLLRYLGRLVKPYDRTTTDALSALDGWLRLPPEEAVVPISRAGLPPGTTPRWPGISPFVTSSVCWALYAFLRTPSDYWSTLGTAIAAGGDVDTTAAMAGAMSGAWLGATSLPSERLACLTDQGEWGRADLERLARAAALLAR